MNIKDIISNLSIDEKISLLTGKSRWNTFSVERLGVPSISVSDGPHGLRKREFDKDGKSFTRKAVCFPTLSAISTTWNIKLIYEVGKALGEESSSMEVDILLGPGTNIKRTPVCGRNFEYFSEDPLLAGELSAAYIDGVQSMNVGTSLKHFAANNQEFERFQVSSEVDIRALREIYLKPFEIAVKKAKPWTVMCAYNRLNGIFCSENRLLLNDILREEWGFDGFVLSDWDAVHNRIKSLKASLELEMPFNEKSGPALMEAYKKGEITIQEINSAIGSLLNIIDRACKAREKRVTTFDVDNHSKLAKEAALEAVVLLKNEDTILPIKKEKIKKLAVIGRFANEPIIQGAGSACVEPVKVENALDRILEINNNEIEIEYFPVYHTLQPEVSGTGKVIDYVKNADIAIVFVGNRVSVESEGFDRESIKLPGDMEKLILTLASYTSNIVVVVQAGSAIDMSDWINKVKAIIFAGYTGQAGGSAVADIIFGLSNPCAKITETFPLRLEDTPAYSTYPGNGNTSWYSEGIMVGYRYYDTFKKDILFPFGHGLSYTTFEYSDLKVSSMNSTLSYPLKVSFKVKNTGSIYGKEIPQLYVKDISSKVLRPEKELKSFGKTGLNPGETKEIEFILDKDAFAYYNISLNKWHVESGEFQILIGASSRDIRLEKKVNIISDYDFS